VNKPLRRRDIVLGGVSASWLFATTVAAGMLSARSAAPEKLASAGTRAAGSSVLLARAEIRARGVEARGLALESFHAERLRPLIDVLATRYGADASHATRIAIALEREGRSTGIDARLLLAVMLVENPWLDPVAVSPVGAIGLMQVMPFHAGGWGCPGGDLEHLEHNICHGARILAAALSNASDLETALLLYNGCVHVPDTADCRLYPTWVFQRGGEAWMDEIEAGLAVGFLVRADVATSASRDRVRAERHTGQIELGRHD